MTDRLATFANVDRTEGPTAFAAHVASEAVNLGQQFERVGAVFDVSDDCGVFERRSHHAALRSSRNAAAACSQIQVALPSTASVNAASNTRSVTMTPEQLKSVEEFDKIANQI